MIDTIRIRLSDFEVMDRNSLVVQPSPFLAENGRKLSNRLLWYSRDSSRPVEGEKAYFNHDVFREFYITIKPDDFTHGPSRSHCWVRLSVPKFYSGSNTHNVGRKETRIVMQKLEERLLKVGIETNIKEATVSRLDLFKNVAADEPFGNYRPLFDLIGIMRTRVQEYDTTYSWSNGQHEFSFYDKRRELESRKKSTEGLPVNFLRFEYRLLRSRKVQTTLGLTTVGELLDGYDGIREHFRQALKDNLFKHKVEDVDTTAAHQIEVGLLAFKSKGERYWVKNWLAAVGARNVLKNVGLDALRVILARHLDRGNVSKVCRQLEEFRFTLESVERQINSARTLADLYRELECKVLAA